MPADSPSCPPSRRQPEAENIWSCGGGVRASIYERAANAFSDVIHLFQDARNGKRKDEQRNLSAP